MQDAALNNGLPTYDDLQLEFKAAFGVIFVIFVVIFVVIVESFPRRVIVF